MKRIAFFISMICTIACAQNEDKTWYFGNGSGINFNTIPPSILTNGNIFTYDNSAAISNNSGQLLFYTNGVSIWNSTHSIMTNGTGLNGNNSGGQSALILKKPNSVIYYVFTVPNHGTGGLYYSIVDMALSGGSGAVTIKNQQLHTPTTEKLAAYFDCNQNRFWLISHKFNSNEFHVYELTASGLNATPVISAVGNIHSGGNPNSSHDAMGQMTLSPDGQILACAQQYNGVIQLFDFNSNSGQVTNPRSINIFSPWGLAFSPNSEKLYTTHWLNPDVEQIDLSNPMNPGIPLQVGTVTGTTGGYGAGYLELAPDNKIYIAKWSSGYLSVIEQPDQSGTSCMFNDNGLFLNGKLSQAGVCRTFNYPDFSYTIAAQQICKTTLFSINDTSSIQSIQWDLGDGTVSASLFPQHSYAPGTYIVTAIINRCNITDTVVYSVTIPSYPTYSIQTDIGCNNDVALSISGTGIQSCTWLNGGGQPVSGNSAGFIYTNPGSYSVLTIVTDSMNCTDTINTTFTLPVTPTAQMQATQLACTNTVGFTNLSANAVSYLWNFGDGNSSSNISPIHNYLTAGTYIIELIAFDSICSDTINQSITINQAVSHEVISSIDTCSKTLYIHWKSPEPDSCIWLINNLTTVTSLTLNYQITNHTLYTITAIANPGSPCADTLALNFDPSFLFANDVENANIFTPNDDLINDCFYLKNFFDCETSNIKIFNRWGEKMYESDNSNDCWEGKNAPEGVYFLLAIRNSGIVSYSITLRR